MKFGFLSLVLILPAFIYSQSEKSGEKPKDDRRIESATSAFNEMMQAKDGGIAKDILQRAHCVGIVPNLKRGALIVGAKYGKGLVTCRVHDSPTHWSAPSMLVVEGGSVGLQIGGGEADIVFAVMNQHGEDSLMRDKFTIGGDVAGMAGPVGREVQAQTDAWMKAEILSWSRAHGLFAGVSLEGASVRPDNDANKSLYGRELTQKEILRGTIPAPAAAHPLLSALERYAPLKPKSGE